MAAVIAEQSKNVVIGHEPDAAARFAIVCVALITSVGLFMVRQGIDSGWPGFDSPVYLTVAYTLLTAVPLLIALLLWKAGDRTPWIGGFAYLLLLTPLALHTGRAIVPGISYGSAGIYFHFYAVLAITTFVLVPFVQARRAGPSIFHYPALFEYAWNNALSLLVAGAFTLAGWMILALWQELFALIGILFFRELFEKAAFAYPACGLFAGIGIVLGRTQTGAVRTILNICLTLGRALFPLAASVTLLFLGALAFNSLEPLWRTRHAAGLLLILVFAVVSLINAVYQDGTQAPAYKAPLRWLANATLLTLPLFVGIAAYALWLRVVQHGWTEQRLWACLITVVAALHAASYAAAVVRRRESWLALIGPANSRIALILVAVLLATQSTLLDFRDVAVNSQVARALAPGADLAKLDLNYMRFEAGKPGNDALQRLKSNPRLAANTDFLANIERVLGQTNQYQPPAPPKPAITAASFTVIPEGAVVPPGLLQALTNPPPVEFWLRQGLSSCGEKPGKCLLMQLDLSQDGGAYWVEVNDCGPCKLPVFGEDAAGWTYRGTLEARKVDAAKLITDLRNHRFSTQASPWKDLVVGDGVRYRFEPAE